MSPKILCALLALTLLANSSHAAPAKPAIAAKSNSDARGVAALDRAVAYYKKQRSFSLSATETVVTNGKLMQRVRLEMSLQMPYRAAMKISGVDANGKIVIPITTRLMDAKNYVSSQLEQPAQTRSIATLAKTRAEITAQMFDVSPSVGLAIVALARGESPASDPYVKSVRYAEIREGKRTLKNVIVTRKGPSDATPIVAEFRLSPQTFAVENVALRGQGAIGKFTVVTRFGPLQSNWKGSQRATDAAIYSWAQLEPRIAIAAPKTKAVAQVDPKARARFARSVELYSGLQGLRASLTKTEGSETTASSFAFDRAGRLRVEGDNEFENLIVIDGKNRWILDESRMNEADEVRYSRETLDEGEATSDALFRLQILFGAAGAFSPLLDETNPLSDLEVEALVDGVELTEFRASVLPPLSLGGEPCDLVRISTKRRDDFSDFKGLTTEQKTYWFARKDARLMRYQERTSQGARETEALDFLVVAQDLNPTFAPDTFKFTPPKGAVLAKD